MATPPATQAAGAVSPGRRASRYGCGCLLVIVIAMLVCGVLVIRQWWGAGRQPVQAALAPITGSVAVLSDGVTIVYSDPTGLCLEEDLAATETRDRVTLALSVRDDLGTFGCTGWRPLAPRLSRSHQSPSRDRPADCGIPEGRINITMRVTGLS